MERVEGRVEPTFDQNTLYAYMKLSNNKLQKKHR